MKIRGTGSSLPKRSVSTEEIAAHLDLDPRELFDRIGIANRNWLSGGERLLDLALSAAKQALSEAEVPLPEIGFVAVSTTSHPPLFPSLAALVGGALGISAPAFDIAATCSGFPYLLSISSALTGQLGPGLMISADCRSLFLSRNAPESYVLFGDGAGAAVVSAGGPGHSVRLVKIGSKGEGEPKIALDWERGKTVRMSGKSVYRSAIREMSRVVVLLLEEGDVKINKVDRFIFHQANGRLLSRLGRDLSIPPDRVIVDVCRNGNTSSASIPIAIDLASREGRLLPGHLLLLASFGAGTTWGGALIDW